MNIIIIEYYAHPPTLNRWQKTGVIKEMAAEREAWSELQQPPVSLCPFPLPSSVLHQFLLSPENLSIHNFRKCQKYAALIVI